MQINLKSIYFMKIIPYLNNCLLKGFLIRFGNKYLIRLLFFKLKFILLRLN